MHKTLVRNLFHLYRYQVILFLLVGTFVQQAQAQGGSFNYENKFSKKNYYFGITLGINMSKFRIERHQSLVGNDTIATINSSFGPGFNLGIVANIKLGENFDFRFMTPTLSFADRRLEYNLTTSQTEVKKIESVFLEFPIHVRYKSKPYKDFRLFVVAGAKYTIDLASNSRSRKADDLIKVVQHDAAVEFGFGFQIFFPYFILSPEIKFSYGVMDILSRDEDLIYSSTIDKLFSRGFAISLHFEG